MALVAYWLLTLLAGAALAELVPFPWRPLERLAASLAVGVVAATLLGFGLSLWLGLGPGPALLAPLLLAGLAGGARWRVWKARVCRLREGWGGHWRALLEDRSLAWALAVAVVSGIGWWWLFRSALSPAVGGGLSAAAHVWADWAVHASYAQSFLLAHNLPPRDSLEAATQMRYPFLVDFQPALLESLGQNLYGALDMSSWAIAWAAGMLVWHLALRVAGRPGAATLALSLVLLGGGLGFVGLYQDGCQQLARTQRGFDAAACTSPGPSTPAAVADFLRHLPTELTHLPRSYDGEDQATTLPPDLQWYEPILVYWMPQRDFAFGMALLAVLGSLLWEARRSLRWGTALAAGLLGAAMPLFNPFGYMVCGLLGLWWLGRRRWALGLAAFLIPLLLLGLPQLAWVVGGPHGQLGGPVGANLFPRLDLGWLSHATTACTAASYLGGASCDGLYLAGASPVTLAAFAVKTLAQPSFLPAWAGFWISNTGVFTLLALLVACLGVLPGRLAGGLREQSRSRGLTAFWAPFWAVFLLANVVITQPWAWDNTKLLSYWYLGCAIPVAWLLTSGRRIWQRLLAGLAVASLLLSGLLSLDAALLGQSSLSQSPPSGVTDSFAGPQEEVVARAVMSRTSADSVFLTEGQPNDPVTVLAGRTVVMAYLGWLWSYGQPLSQRWRAVEAMYRGCPSSGACPLGQLLRRYRVDYVEFEPGDYNDIPLNLNWYEDQHLPVLVRTSDYVIFDVRGLWSRPG